MAIQGFGRNENNLKLNALKALNAQNVKANNNVPTLQKPAVVKTEPVDTFTKITTEKPAEEKEEPTPQINKAKREDNWWNRAGRWIVNGLVGAVGGAIGWSVGVVTVGGLTGAAIGLGIGFLIGGIAHFFGAREKVEQEATKASQD